MFVGAIILFFFVSFGLKYKANAEVGLALTTVNQLDRVLTSASVSSQTSTKITLPKQKLIFSCDAEACTSQGCSSSIILFTPNGEGVSRDVSMLPIFSPKNMKGEEVTTMTLLWKYPFTISNLVYLIPDNIRIYIDINDNDETLIDLNKLLRNFNISAYPYTSNVQFPDGIKAKIITKDPEVLSVTSSASQTLRGNIDVFVIKSDREISTSTGSTVFFDIPTLLGVILSENTDMYECNMKKAVIKYGNVQQIYERRVAELDHELSRLRSERGRGLQCTYQYDSLPIQSIQNNLVDIKTTLDSNKREYERMNENELRRSCPVMY